MKKKNCIENGAYRLVLTDMYAEGHGDTLVFGVVFDALNLLNGDVTTITGSFFDHRGDKDCNDFFNFIIDNHIKYVDYENLIGMVVDVDIAVLTYFDSKKSKLIFSNAKLVAPPPTREDD